MASSEQTASAQGTPGVMSPLSANVNSGFMVAVNHGVITSHVHNYPQQLKSKVWIDEVGLQLFDAIPIRDDQFIGRAEALQDLEELLLTKDGQPALPRKVVVSGLGGMGKTQLILHFARLHQDRFSSIICLNASSKVNLRRGLSDLAKLVNEMSGEGPEVQEPSSREDTERDEEELALMGRTWLSTTARQGWLLLLDNYDDPAGFQGYTSSSGYDIRTLFPQRMRGSAIITSRAILDIFDNRLNLMKINDLDESLRILYQRSERLPPERIADASASALARRLDGLPLALSTAGAYLRLAPDQSFADYLALYDREYSRLGGIPEPLPELSSNQDRTLFTTWNVSFKRIKSIDSVAANFLSFLVYFDPQGVWYDLFRNMNSSHAPEWLITLARDQFLFRRTLKILVEHSLITVDSAQRMWVMHQCVHDWLWATTQLAATDYDTLEAACKTISDYSTKSGHASPWEPDRKLEPHVLQMNRVLCVTQPLPPGEYTQVPIAICHMSNILLRSGKSKESETMLLWALESSEDHASPDGHVITTVRSHLAAIYKNMDRLDEAEEMCIRALRMKELWDGQDPSSLSTLNEILVLAGIYWKREKYKEAELLWRRALHGKEQILGASHQEIFIILALLGSAYSMQGRLEESEEFYSKSVAGFEQTLGYEDPTTLRTTVELAALYYQQNKLDEAEACDRRALPALREKLGPIHNLTLATTNYLGTICAKNGKLEEGVKLVKQAISGYEIMAGPNNTTPEQLEAIENLGIIYDTNNQFDKAEPMFRRVLQAHEKTRGKHDVVTLRAVYKLALAIAQQDRPDEAEPFFQRACEGFEQVRGIQNLDTNCVRAALGQNYVSQGRLLEAQEMFSRVLSSSGPDFRPWLHQILDSLDTVAIEWHQRQRFDEAASVFLQVMVSSSEELGPRHSMTLLSRVQLGRTYSSQRQHDEAETIHRDALEGFNTLLGTNDATSIELACRVACTLATQTDRRKDAEIIYQRALKHCWDACRAGGNEVLENVEYFKYFLREMESTEAVEEEAKTWLRHAVIEYKEPRDPQQVKTGNAAADGSPQVTEDSSKVSEAVIGDHYAHREEHARDKRGFSGFYTRLMRRHK